MNEGGTPENLKPFQPGQSGNPAGKKKGTLNMKTLMTQVLEANAPQKIIESWEKLGLAGKPTMAQAVVLVAVKEAINGNTTAMKEILDRIDGKVPQALQHTGDPENPIYMAEIKEIREKHILAVQKEIEEEKKVD